MTHKRHRRFRYEKGKISPLDALSVYQFASLFHESADLMLMRAPLREGAVAMRFAVILAVLALIGVAGVWLFAGRQFVLLLDCIATGPAEALPGRGYLYSAA